MAGRPKEPIDLIIAKGKKHLTKEEIAERKSKELKIKHTDVNPPEYLSEKEKKEFNNIANILLEIGIMTELDEECLAHYLIANTNYINYTKELRTLEKKLTTSKDEEKKKEILGFIDLYLKYQDRALKQCRDCANDMGLSISSRCKLVMPQTKEPPKENKFAKFLVTNK